MYLSSDAAEEEKKSTIMFRGDNRMRACLHNACGRGAPDDIIKAMIDIGGKDLVMMKDNDNWTVLHSACIGGASYNIIKMLIEVDGKDLVMAKNKYGNTALHYLCMTIMRHDDAVDKIKLILQVGDSNLLLSAKNTDGDTPLTIATDKGAPDDVMKAMIDIMSSSNLFNLCGYRKWPEVRKYLCSDAAEEEKKSNIMYRNHNGWTCLYAACNHRAPDDIIKAMIDLGGKELVMPIDNVDKTALHRACINGASYDIIKILIDVGGRDLVMAKDKKGNTALHWLCLFINPHTKVAKKIRLFLQVGDNNLLLSAKNYPGGKTPLEIVTDKGTSKKIKMLLTLQSFTNSTRSNNSPSTNIAPADNITPITQSNQEQDTTQSSSTNNDPNIPIRGLAIDQNHQSQLREAKEQAKTIQQDLDQKCIDYSDLEEYFQSQLKEAKEAKEQRLQIQQDYDQKCADCCHLEEVNQVENTEKLQLGSALNLLQKELYKCKRMKVDLENKVEAQGAAEITLKAKLQEMKDKVGTPVAGIQMIKQEEGEAARAQELLEESNRRAADLEATVETQKSEIADLSNEKDGIEKECMDKVDNLTRQLSKQQAELQQLKKSSSEVEVGMKRKHTNEEHEEGEGTAIQSQTRSSKRRRAGNTRNASSDSLNTNQAEDDDAELKDMLTTRYLYTRKQLQRANARIAQFEEENDRKGSAKE
jgi:ankyrin repeat protein